MFKTYQFGQSKLPLVIEPEEGAGATRDAESLISFYAEHRKFLESKLLEHGALLFRGFSVESADALERFARSEAGGELLGYVDGTSPRTRVDAGVYTSTEYPPAYFISLHNELSYTNRWPSKLFFCCVTAPQEGGETPIVDSRALLRSLPPEVVGQFREKGVRYVRNLHGGRGLGLSWQSVFETEDKAAVENYCREGGVDFRWKENGGLWLSQVRPAVATHPQTGEEVWFNQADQFHTTEMDERTRAALLSYVKEEELPKNAYFGDGTPLDVSMLEQIREATRSLMVLFKWEAGDLLMVDNMLAAHGRMPFKGPRKILVALS
ncbi:MAG TPA: TauD/TfdA family dioxygenase [Pyrinomonadaceae bacterium]|nr:TauD/TfdA family dioxygenase [Pyrinomonadaceae bacterium]